MMDWWEKGPWTNLWCIILIIVMIAIPLSFAGYYGTNLLQDKILENRETITTWLTSPISNLKIWHLLVMLLVYKLLS